MKTFRPFLISAILSFLFFDICMAQSELIFENFTSANGINIGKVRAIAIDAENNKWLGTYDNGVFMFDGENWVQYNTSNSDLTDNDIYSIAIDTSGNKWFGTWGNGVAKFDGNNWTVYNTSNSGLPDNDVHSIAIDASGNKWFGTWGGGVAKFDGNNWTVYNTSNSGLPDNYVRSIAIDASGNKWFGTWGGGVAKFDGNNWTVYNTSNSGLPYNYVLSIAIDANDNKWFGTYGGVAKFDGNNWTVYNTSNSGLPDNDVWSIAIDASGNKWFGTFGGVAKFDGNNWTVYNTSNSGLPNNYVYSIAIDASGNKWFGTSEGISLGIDNSYPTDISISNVYIEENIPVGSIVGTLSTTDILPENDTHTYELISGGEYQHTDYDKFYIEDNQLKTVMEFDYETSSKNMNIYVRTTDSGGLTFDKHFIIKLTNVNEPPLGIALDNTQINETSEIGTIIGTISAEDTDINDSWSFSLQSNVFDNNSFNINGDKLQTNTTFDYRDKNEYTIEITATDAGGLSIKQVFEIKILPLLPYYSTNDGWDWRNPSPFGGDFRCIEIASTENFLIGADYGIIVRSKDYGESWNQSELPVGFNENIKRIRFFDAQNGYAISDDALLQSTDSGKVWTQELLLMNETVITPRFLSLSKSDNTLYLLTLFNGQSQLWQRTTEGSWEQTESPAAHLTGMEYPYFWNENTIYKNDQIIFSSDENSCYIKQVAALPDSEDFLFLCRLNGVFALYKNNLNTNIGQSAQDPDGVSASTAGFVCNNAIIRIIDNNTVYVADDELYRFTDNLADFRKLTTNGLDRDPNQQLIINDFVQSGNTRIAITRESGMYISSSVFFVPSVSQQRSIVEKSRCVYFISPNTGYILQSDAGNAPTMVYRTQNGGINWHEYVRVQYDITGADKFFVTPDDSKCFILQNDGNLIIQDIENQNNIVIENNITDFHFIDPEKGWYLTRNNELYVTENTGDEWTKIFDFGDIPEAANSQINTLCFVNSEVGFIGGSTGLMMKSEDGGSSWDLVLTSGEDINSILFVDEQTGFIGADYGLLFRTTDGGKSNTSWEHIPLSINDEVVTDDIHAYQFWDSNIGYIVTEDGLLTTTDGGQTFSLQQAPLGLPVGHEQKTPSLFVLNGLFERFIYSRDNFTFTSKNFDDDTNSPQILTLSADDIPGVFLFPVFETAVPIGEQSEPLSYSLMIANLTNDLVITAPTHFLVSKNQYSTFQREITFTPAELQSGAITVYVVFAPTAYAPELVGAFSGDGGGGIQRNSATRPFRGSISHRCEGAISLKIPVKGWEGIPLEMTASVTDINFDEVRINSTSGVESYTVSLPETIEGTLKLQIENSTKRSGSNAFYISKTQNGGFSGQIEYSSNELQNNEVGVYVIFDAAEETTTQARIAHTATGYETMYVNLLGTGISTTITDIHNERIKLMPNPARDYLYLKIPDKSIYKIQILDITGRTILSDNVFSEKKLDISHLKNGYYFVIITKGNHIFVKKIIKHD